MICELVMIAGMAVNPCNVEALERAPHQLDRCILVTKQGRRYAMNMTCGELFAQLNKEKESPDR